MAALPAARQKTTGRAGLRHNPLTLSPDTEKSNPAAPASSPLTPDDATPPPHAHTE